MECKSVKTQDTRVALWLPRGGTRRTAHSSGHGEHLGAGGAAPARPGTAVPRPESPTERRAHLCSEAVGPPAPSLRLSISAGPATPALQGLDSRDPHASQGQVQPHPPPQRALCAPRPSPGPAVPGHTEASCPIVLCPLGRVPSLPKGTVQLSPLHRLN